MPEKVMHKRAKNIKHGAQIGAQINDKSITNEVRKLMRK